MAPEDWKLNPWKTIVWNDALADIVEPLSKECFILERLFRERVIDEQSRDGEEESDIAS